jgi:hypothetical protein
VRWGYNDGGRAASGFKGEADDCVVRAVAIAADLAYRDVYDALNDLTRDARIAGRRHGARTGIPRNVYQLYLENHGFVWYPIMGIGTGTTVHLRDGEIPTEGRHVARLSKHLCAIVDGVVLDTHDPSRNGTRAVYGLFSMR